MSENIEVGGVVAKISMDDSGINKSMAELSRQMKGVQGQFSLATAKLGAYASEEDKLRVKADSLTKQIDIQQQKVKVLRDRHMEAATAKGEDAKETQNLAVQLSKAEAHLSGMQNDLSKTNDEIKKQTSLWSKLHNSLDTASTKIKNVGQSMSNVGRSLSLSLTAPLLAIGGGALKTSIDFESAFAGVRKTVNATSVELAGFRQGIRDMAQVVPTAATEIAKVAESAGQLGIQNKALLSFTRTMVDMGVSTNLTADEAATAMARIANITQMPQDQFDRLGATVVALGNAGASTEKEIVDMALRIAGAGHQVGMTQAQILALANGLSSVGVEAEAGGSSISTTMIDMAKSVAMGGNKLELFARVAGTTSNDFKQKFKSDASGAMVDFIEGLKRVGDAGGNTFAVLDALGLGNIRVRDSLLRASGAGDLFRQSLELGNKAWDQNTALNKEASQRYATTESQLKIFWNRLKDVGITLGDALAPALIKVIDAAKPFIDMLSRAATWFAHLDGKSQTMILAIAGIAAALGPVLIVLGMLTTAIGLLISPIGLVVVGVLALAAVAAVIVAKWEPIKAFFLKLWAWIDNFFGGWGAEVLAILLPFIGIPLTIAKHWDAIKGFFVGIWNWAKTFFSKWGIEVLAVLVPFIGLPLLIAKHWDQIKSFFNGIWNWVKTFFSKWGIEILAVVAPFIGLPLLIRKHWDEIKAWFSGLWTKVRDIFTAGAVKANDAIMKGLQAGLDWMLGLPAKTIEIGKNIIQGLIDGIGKMANAVADKVKEVAASIGDGIKNFFGIASPSKLTTQYGANIMEGLSIGIDKSAKKAEAAAKRAAAATAKAIKDHFSNAFKDADFKLKMGQIDLTQYIASMQKIKSEYGKTADQIRKIDLAIKAARDKFAKQQAVDEKKQFDASKQWIEQKKSANELSLSEELAAWERVQSRYKQGSKERIEADKNVLRVRKDIIGQLTKANDDYLSKVKEINANLVSEEKQLNAAYDQAVKDRAKAISDFAGLFDAVTLEAGKSGDELLNNLQGQVDYLDTWSSSFQNLSKRGVDSGLLEELRQMGPKATPELIALNKLTDEQLVKYQSLWKRKSEQSRTEAVDELKGLRTDTDKQITDLRTAAIQQLETLRTDFNKQIKAIRGDTNDEMSLLKEDMPTLGQQAMAGLMNGLNSMKGPLQETARSIADSIKQTLKQALQLDGTSTDSLNGKIPSVSGGSSRGITKAAAALASAVIPGITGMGLAIAGAGSGGSPTVNNNFHGDVIIPVKDLKEVKSVSDLFDKLQQAARTIRKP